VVDTVLTRNFKKLTGLQFKGKGVLLFCEITVFFKPDHRGGVQQGEATQIPTREQ